MKRTVLIAGLVLAAAGLWAQAGQGTLERALESIRQELRLGASEQIDPAKVPDSLLEELGEAVMTQLMPDQRQHEWMDEMMGGEGSPGLASMHRWMGYRYLGGGWGAQGGMMGGPGMMGGMMMGPYGLRGNPNLPYGGNPYRSPEEIVKERYAKGEISREQYDQLLRDLDR